MKRLINWVEIPATDLARAEKFYNSILGGIEFHKITMEGTQYALFPSMDKFNAGALVQGEYYKPSSDGVIVYLDGGKDLDNILRFVENEGGEIIMPKTFIGEEAGFIGMFIDTEGNKIGLHHL